MEVVRMLWSSSALRKCSLALSCIAVLFGAIALFSNNWVSVGSVHSGFINSCAEGICASVQSQMPDNWKTTYVFGVILMIYMPLILVFVAAVLQGITVWRGPSKRLDLSATICAWLSSYHGILLTVIVIAAAKMSSFPTPGGTEPQYTDPEFENSWSTSTQRPLYDNEPIEEIHHSASENESVNNLDWSVGWSAYLGMFALIFGLVSAIISTVYSGRDDKAQSDDNIPLESDYA